MRELTKKCNKIFGKLVEIYCFLLMVYLFGFVAIVALTESKDASWILRQIIVMLFITIGISVNIKQTADRKRRLFLWLLITFFVFQFMLKYYVTDMYAESFFMGLICCLFAIYGRRKKQTVVFAILSLIGQFLEIQYLILFYPMTVLIGKLDEITSHKKSEKNTELFIAVGLVVELLLQSVCADTSISSFLVGDRFRLCFNYTDAFLCTTLICLFLRVLEELEMKKMDYIIVFFVYFVLCMLAGKWMNSGNLYFFCFICTLFTLSFRLIGEYIYVRKNSWKSLLLKTANNKTNIFIALICLFMFYICFFSYDVFDWRDFNSYPLNHYYLDYLNFGFVQRGLIGTFVYLVFGKYISVSQMIIIIIGLQLVAAMMIIYLLWKIYRKCTVKDAALIKGIIVLYLTGPAFTGYFCKSVIGSLDIYSLSLSLLCVYLVLREKLVWTIPVVCGLCMLNHQIYAALIFPLVFIVLTYKAFVGEDKVIYYRCVLGLTLLTVALLFVFIQFYSNAGIRIDREMAGQVIYEKSLGMKCEPMLFDGVLYTDVKNHIDTFQGKLGMRDYLKVVKNMLWFSPLIALYFQVFFYTARDLNESYKRIICKMIPFSCMTIFVCYAMETDYERWTIQFLSVLILSILFVTASQSKNTDEKKWYNKLDHKTLKSWLCLIWLMLYFSRNFDFMLTN